jgi:hypothetical protein
LRSRWHFNTSQRIARELGYGDCVARWIAVGNAAVDVRHWRRDCAHGMTHMHEGTGLPALALDVAQAHWKSWIEHNERLAHDWLTRVPDQHAGYYFLGVALHAIQDQECHLGMTIAEHARRYLRRDDPDLVPDALARGEVVTRQYLGRLIETTPAPDRRTCCQSSSSAYRAFVRPPDGTPMDTDVSGYLWQGVRWLRTEPPIVRWPQPTLETPTT